MYLRKKRIYNPKINTYVYQKEFYLMTTRFNNDTYLQNRHFVNKNPKIKCVYGSPILNADIVPIDKSIMILEMNNEENRIEGIGFVKNHPIHSKYRIYNTTNRNRFVYLGKQHISRNEMTEEEEIIMKFFDIICFRGKRHLKRGCGITSFPHEILYKCKYRLDLIDFLYKMYNRRFVQK